ncbi:pyridoxal phosphate enzyme, YggS family [Platysternon megacephalum]|uniref:Pyridoxal phosphate enzyme, YggS family n=1 Tax=Platysternon megacephalum TaxID=55544 RepID=A0A4D9DGZ1_9SAUR|nr:pyridoxal phosphate enzyme, YggS family [Platysternon megacephalum]
MWAEGPCRIPSQHQDGPRLVAAHHRESCQAVHPPCGSYHAEPAAPPPPAPQPCAPSLEQFASRSSLHGIHHIFAHGPYTGRHLLWTLAFLGSLGLLLHVYAERVGYYFQYPHNTQLEEQTVPRARFPAITLCNLNRARFSQLTAHDLYWAGELLGLLDSSHQPLAPEPLDMPPLSPEEQRRPFDLLEFYGRTGHRLDLGHMLLSCRFVNETCNASDFRTVSARPPPRAGALPGAAWRGRGGGARTAFELGAEAERLLAAAGGGGQCLRGAGPGVG